MEKKGGVQTVHMKLVLLQHTWISLSSMIPDEASPAMKAMNISMHVIHWPGNGDLSDIMELQGSVTGKSFHVSDFLYRETMLTPWDVIKPMKRCGKSLT